MRNEFKERLMELRDGYSDQIPEGGLHSTSGNNRFKVRKGWFQSLVANLANGIGDGEITDPVVVRKIERGLKRFTSERFHQQPLTSKRDIRYANLLINLVLVDKTT